MVFEIVILKLLNPSMKICISFKMDLNKNETNMFLEMIILEMSMTDVVSV